MQKPGETVVRVEAGSAQEWLHFFLGMTPFVGVCFVLGAIIAIVLRGRPSWHAPVSIIVAVSFYALLLWWQADPDVWSWRYPISSALYQIGPAAIFFMAPTLLGAGIVRWFFSRHAKSI
jgi:Na+-translocating ferredoxin:NAD+ oxidoreductase RnfD subunit